MEVDRETNPYQAPQVGQSPWFRWSRVPYGLYRGCCGYLDQMRRDGGSAVGHLVCWAGILMVVTLTGLLLCSIAFHLLSNIFPK